MNVITNPEFEKIKTKALIIDVREHYEFENLAKLKYSHNIPVKQIMKNYKTILKNKEKLIIIVCNGGNRSGYIANYLNEKGYSNTYLLEEGIYGYYQ